VDSDPADSFVPKLKSYILTFNTSISTINYLVERFIRNPAQPNKTAITEEAGKVTNNCCSQFPYNTYFFVF
jgi:hypothetical protein